MIRLWILVYYQTVMSTNINGSTTPALSHSNLFVGLALPGIHFLYNYSWTDHRTDNDFQASLTVAKVLLRVSSKDPDILMKFVDVSTEVSTIHTTTSIAFVNNAHRKLDHRTRLSGHGISFFWLSYRILQENQSI